MYIIKIDKKTDSDTLSVNGFSFKKMYARIGKVKYDILKLINLAPQALLVASKNLFQA